MSLQDALRAAAERVAADGGEDADAVMAEFLRVQEKDISRLTVPEWFSRFAYVVTGDQWFDLCHGFPQGAVAEVALGHAQ